jgi:signal transduction histidine kinase
LTDRPEQNQAIEEERRSWSRRRRDIQLLKHELEFQVVRLACEPLFQRIGVDALVQQTLHIALQTVGAETGSVVLADPDARTLVFKYSVGEKPVVSGTAFPWDQGITGSVFHSGKAAVVQDVKKDSRHLATIDTATGYTTRDMISLPLKRWEGEPIGVLNVLNKRQGRLSEDDLGILTLIAAFAAVAIEQARLYEESKLAEVARLVGNMTHDLKNLMTPVAMAANLLRDDVKDLFAALPAKVAKSVQPFHERFTEAVEVMSKSSGLMRARMKEIADCIKGLSAPPHFTDCHLAEVVRNVFTILAPVAQEKGVRLTIEGFDEVRAIQADGDRLFNAFYNLVDNAIDATDGGGAVTIRGAENQTARAVRVSVKDTGRGMPPGILASLFKPGAISRKKGGTGLGTKIVKDVVDAHGGTVRAESEEGKGSTFHLTLPFNPAGA